jgi:hypothetical protein
MLQSRSNHVISSSGICKPLAIIVALLGMAGCGTGQHQPQQAKTPQNGGQIVFEPIEIRPSPNGEDYIGRFRFVNKGSTSVKLSGFGKPKHGRFKPAYIAYQMLQKGLWVDIRTTSCGLIPAYAMKPDESYELFVDFFSFDEQDTPLTARIGLAEGRFWSEPFVLDWKNDRKGGKFASARKENFQESREAFSKAGFKRDLLVGDDFCSRLLQSMMVQMAADGDTVPFAPFRGRLDVTPTFLLDGKILIDFESDETVRPGRSQYEGRFVLDPNRFNRRWFQNARDKFVNAEWSYGSNWMDMSLYDGTSDMEQGDILILEIKYSPFEKSKVPSQEDSKKAFNRVLDALDS